MKSLSDYQSQICRLLEDAYFHGDPNASVMIGVLGAEALGVGLEHAKKPGGGGIAKAVQGIAGWRSGVEAAQPAGDRA